MQHLRRRLVELRLSGIAPEDLRVEVLDGGAHVHLFLLSREGPDGPGAFKDGTVMDGTVKDGTFTDRGEAPGHRGD
ncbi:hypothetical protein Shyhy02_53470 [Streptomyces hygroscopicus subsp. hygroscopicus]|nr:hypothetical protein Shyhy02_53470 [Streptomyces hygroscopicus subsp. hygroscopicus]